jgi:hypothetical protein
MELDQIFIRGGVDFGDFKRRMVEIEIFSQKQEESQK